MLTFEEKTHTYRLNGEVIPSVTQIMKPLSEAKYGAVDPQILARAAKRGTAVHEAIETYVKTGMTDIEGQYSGYFEAFRKFMDDVNPTYKETEMMFANEGLRYAGTTDAIMEIDGKRVMVDYKTSSTLLLPLVSVQLEAYKLALMTNGITVDETYALHLKDDGNYKFVKVGGAEYLNTFMSLLTVRSFIEKNLK